MAVAMFPSERADIGRPQTYSCSCWARFNVPPNTL